MRPQLYDEKSARLHIKKVTDILDQPQVLSIQQQTSPEEEQLASIDSNPALSDADKAIQRDEVIREMQRKQADRQKQMYDNFVKIIEKDAK